MADDRAWDGRSRGGGIGHAIVALLARVGPGSLYVLLIVPVLFYFCWERPARRASIDYWRRLAPGSGRWALLCRSFRHFHHFGCMLSDRLLVGLRPDRFPCRHLGARGMARAMRHPQGCILLSAHFGNWELAGRWLKRYPDTTINLVMYQGEDPAVQAQIEAVLGSQPFNVIDLSDVHAAALAIASALRRGETCCMLGDRTAGRSDASNECAFLGATARFPIGPFQAALVTGALIVPTFAIKTADGYDLIAWPAYRVQAASRRDRSTAIRAAQQRYVRLLTYHIRRHPEQWHNFYPFWTDTAESS